MRWESVDLIAQNVKKIRELFPNCITKTVDGNGRFNKPINFESRKQMLSEYVIDGDETYEFTWIGKRLPLWR